MFQHSSIVIYYFFVSVISWALIYGLVLWHAIKLLLLLLSPSYFGFNLSSLAIFDAGDLLKLRSRRRAMMEAPKKMTHRRGSLKLQQKKWTIKLGLASVH